MTAHESTDQLESSAEVAQACLISTGLAHESVGWQSWSWMASLACWQFAGCQLGVQMMHFSSYNRLAGACAHSGGLKEVETPTAIKPRFGIGMASLLPHVISQSKSQDHFIQGTETSLDGRCSKGLVAKNEQYTKGE